MRRFTGFRRTRLRYCEERCSPPRVLLDDATLFCKLRFSQWALSHKSPRWKRQTISPCPSARRRFFTDSFCAATPPSSCVAISRCPPAVLAKWHREAEREPALRDIFGRMVEYRRHVLALFDLLVDSDGQNRRPQ